MLNTQGPDTDMVIWRRPVRSRAEPSAHSTVHRKGGSTAVSGTNIFLVLFIYTLDFLSFLFFLEWKYIIKPKEIMDY